MATERIQPLIEVIIPTPALGFIAISQDYTHLEIPFKIRGTTTSSASLVTVIVNTGLTTSEYDFQYGYYSGSSPLDGESSTNQLFYIPNSDSPSNSFTRGVIWIENYTQSSRLKIMRVEHSQYEAVDDLKVHSSACVLTTSTDPITSLAFGLTDGNFEVGSFFDLRGL